METPLPPPAEPAPPKRRARRILIWTGTSLAALLLVIIVAAPPIIAGAIRTKLQSTLNDRIDGTSAVGDVSFSWTGGATIRDVDIKDRAGAPLASVKSIAVDLSLLSALGGRLIADVRIDSPRIEIRRRGDGRLNLAAAVKPDAAPDSSPSPPTRDLPFLEVKLNIQDAVAVIVGEKESTRFELSGAYALKHDAGRVTLSGRTAVKDGSVATSIDADLRRAGKADVKIDRVPLDARMGPILELLHPALSAAGGKLDGFMEGDLALSLDGPLTAGEDELLKRLSGAGRIEIRDSSFAGSQFLGELMAALAIEKREIKLRPLGFRIAGGRIHYDKPWSWTISGSETTFTGSIGLDRTLDLVWHIPVTDVLASRVPALKSSKGQTCEIAIKGTVTRPRLDWKGAIAQVAEDKLEEAAKKGIESLLGGKDEKKAGKLLEEADALHRDGKPAEAAAKYRKIKDDYRKTRVYKDNKERIDPRAEGK